MKSKGYPAAIVAFVAVPLMGLGIVLAWFQMNVVIEPLETEIAPVPAGKLSSPQDPIASLGAASDSELSVSSDATSSATSGAEATAQVEAGNQNPELVANRAGTIRVSNQTAHPIRVVLRGQDREAQTSEMRAYRKPAHWDFAPEEGSEQGLLLSLPNEDLQLKQGDVLIAFAQDGSRRYWGPYVVGETAIPTWEKQGEEWGLVLRP